MDHDPQSADAPPRDDAAAMTPDELDAVSGGVIINSVTHRPSSGGTSGGTSSTILQSTSTTIEQGLNAVSSLSTSLNNTATSIINNTKG